MAIDKRKVKGVVEKVNDAFEALAPSLSKKQKEALQAAVFGPALQEISRLVDDARAPRLFMTGRSGHGKSALLNALAGRKVQEVNPLVPQTPKSEMHIVSFPNRHASWEITDSRGFFESLSPDGSDPQNVEETLKKDIREARPDVLLHVIKAEEARNLSKDLEFMEALRNHLRKKSQAPPTLIVLNMVDKLSPLSHWPPEEHSDRQGDIVKLMRFLCTALQIPEKDLEWLDPEHPERGVRFREGQWIGIIPCAASHEEPERRWNLETLATFLGEALPTEARLFFFQGPGMKLQLRSVSKSLTDRFSVIAMGIGAIPIPFSDIAILTPLQLLLVAMIGGLSCRDLGKEVVVEFATASGGTIAAGIGLRAAARQLVKVVPFAGSVVSAGIAGSGTWTLGRSAEVYFFDGVFRKPGDFMGEFKTWFSRRKE